MADPIIHRFDGSALYSALDARRAELGLSWKLVADQLWQQSSELNDRRRDHPISPSTLRNMATKPRTTCQHALFMLRWLDRTPESFLAGMANGDDPRFALPPAGADRRLRWSLKLLWATTDEKRQQEGLTRRQLADILRLHPESTHRVENSPVRDRYGPGHAHRPVDRPARCGLRLPRTVVTR